MERVFFFLREGRAKYNFVSSLLSFGISQTFYHEEIYMKFKPLILHALICIFPPMNSNNAR